MSDSILQRFLAELDTVDPLAETYSLSLWQELTPAERELAERALLDRIETDRDPRAIMTLACVQSPHAQATLEPLSQLEGFLGVWARRALLRLTGSPGDAARVAADVHTGATLLERFAAVSELGHHLTVEVANSLDAALEDTDSLVRSQALDLLIPWYKLTPYVTTSTGANELRSPLKVLGVRLTIDLEPVWRKAAAQIRWILTQVEMGARPEALDLVYHPTESPDFGEILVDALSDSDVALPREQILACRGHDRAWAETLLLAALEPGRSDARVPTILSQMNTIDLPEILEAAAAGSRNRAFLKALREL